MRTIFLFALLAGCVQPLDPGSLITRSRVLGARIEVAGDATRSWPAPGETANLSWVVAAPDEAPELAWAFAACTSSGGAGCSGDPFATATASGTIPTLAFAVPAPAADATAVQLLGVICADGTPAVDGEAATCTGDAPTETDAMLTVPLALDGVGNHNPSLAADAITFDGRPWPALDAEPPLTGCAAEAGRDALPLAHADKTETHIGVALVDSDREPITVTLADGTSAPSRESLQVSHFTTAGTLARQFSVVDGGDSTTAPAIDVTWTGIDSHHTMPPADGLRVRFTFVLRDGRGGLAATTRDACLVP